MKTTIGILLSFLPLFCSAQLGTFELKTQYVEYWDAQQQTRVVAKHDAIVRFDREKMEIGVLGFDPYPILNLSDDGCTTTIETEEDIWILKKDEVKKISKESKIRDAKYFNVQKA